MLEIASEITVCLLIAATIGAAIGYLICKSLSEKTDSVAVKPHTEEKAEAEEKEVVIEETPEVSQETIEETIEDVTEKEIEDEIEIKDESTTEEVEIPTEGAIEKALEALEEIDEQDDKIPEVEEESDKKPELLSSPRNGKKDDLTQIKGLGPKMQEKLNTAGIYHFDQIASWTEADFEWLEANTAFASRAKKDNWVSQAKSFI